MKDLDQAFGADFSWALWDEGEGPSFALADQSAAPTDLVVASVSRPHCFGFLPARPNGGALLVLAGGGYTQLVVGKEGVEVALWLAALGFHAFVLVHRFPNAACGAQAPADDARRAMAQIRVRAAALGFKRDAVGALGLSSGGHLAACLVARYPDQWTAPQPSVAPGDSRPDFLIVGYGPISTNAAGRTIIRDKPPLPPPEKQALYDALQPDLHLIEAPPPAFLVYAADDPIVPVENGRRLHAAFGANGVAAELHVFAHAPHGFALRERELPVGAWPDLCATWLKSLGLFD